MLLIETKNLTKKYKNALAVDSLNIKIRSGELTAYLGTNGAGKSTTIKMLTNTILPTSGKIKFEGMGGARPYMKKKAIGVVFQESILDNELTVIQNLKIRAALYQDISAEKIDALMVLTHIKDFAQKKYGDLSGGMRRKVDIARALIHSPKILFLDEPTTGLDIQARKEVWDILNTLKSANNLAIFLTTHYLEEADYADYVYVLEKGRLLEEGSARQLKEKHGRPTLWITPINNQTLEKIAADYPLIIDRNKGQGIPVASPKEAMTILAKISDWISDFTFKPIDMNDVFLAISGKEFMDHESHF